MGVIMEMEALTLMTSQTAVWTPSTRSVGVRHAMQLVVLCPCEPDAMGVRKAGSA